MGKLLKLGIVIGASLSSGFTSALTSARASLGKIGDNAKRLSQTRLDTGEFKKLSRSVGESKSRMGELSSALHKTGSEVRSLNRDSKTLGSTFQKLKNQSSIKGAMESNRNALANAQASYIGIAAAVGGALIASKSLINASSDVAKAQGEIASLGIPESGIKSITRAGRGFSNMWAGTGTAEFVRASYDIKSGISSLGDDAVGEYTRIAALTASATKSTTEEMTSLFAKGFGIYRKQFNVFGENVIGGWNKLSAEERDVEFGKYFSAGIASTVQAFRTKGSEMSAALSTLGADATTAGLTFSEQLAILGTLQRQMSGSESATKMKAFLRSVSKAGKELKLDFVNKQTGMLKSIPDILDQIKKHYGGMLDEAALVSLGEAFGDTEAASFAKALIDDSKMLRSGFANINKSLSTGLKLTTQMATDMQRGQGFTLLGQQATNMSSILGDVLSPAAMLVGGVLSKIAMNIQWLGERFPRLTGACFGLAGGLIAILIASKAVGVGVAWMNVGLGNFAKLAPGIAGSLTGLSAAILATPVGWIIGGILAIVAAGVVVWKYWAQISTFFKGVWQGIMQGLAPIAGALSTAFAPIKPLLGSIWNVLKPIFSAIGDFFGSLFTQSKPSSEALKLIFAVGLEWGKKFGSVIGAVLSTIIAGIGEIVSGFKLVFGFWSNLSKGNFKGMAQAFKDFWSESKANASSAGAAWKNAAISHAPKLAAGGIVKRPTFSLVGESGPEAVVPLKRFQFAMAGGGSAGSISIHAPITINAQPGMDAREIAEAVQRELRIRESQAAARARGSLYD